MTEDIFSNLVGKVLQAVTVDEGDDPRVTFICGPDERYGLFHCQDCCEHVYIESIVGDLNDLLGTENLMAEEATSTTGHIIDDPFQPKPVEENESQTWTFYKLRTIKGSVDIRWHGVSNGYYSESVTFARV